MLLSTLWGCWCAGKNGSASPGTDPETALRTAMEAQLEEKYGETFTVETLRREDANMAFSQDTYRATVHSAAYGADFNARVNADGSHLVDDYPRLFWKQEMENRVQQALDQLPAVVPVEWKAVYVLSAACWQPSDGIDTYLTESDSYIDLTLTLPNDGTEQTARLLNKLRDALQQQKLQYAVAVRWKGKTLVFAEKRDQPRLTDEAIRQKLERSLA